MERINNINSLEIMQVIGSTMGIEPAQCDCVKAQDHEKAGREERVFGAVSSLAVVLGISRKVDRDDYKRNQSIMLKK